MWQDMSNTRWWGNYLILFSSIPVVWWCICFPPVSWPCPCWRRPPWWVPVCRTASKTAAIFSTCRHHLQGWGEPACGGSARGRCLPLYLAFIFKKSDGKRRMDIPWIYEPQVEKAALCIWFICHLMVSLRKADCFWAIMTLKL